MTVVCFEEMLPRKLVQAMPPRHPHKDVGLFTGVADASNDPELTATPERGQTLLTTIAASPKCSGAADASDVNLGPNPPRTESGIAGQP